MTDPQRCSSCGLPRHPPGPVGLCPACLIKLGWSGSDAAADAGLDDARETDPTGPDAFIGPYRILGTLGEGGMGVVYLAEQAAPLQRQVAVKVIKLGMDTREVVARFEAERQALALMEHPNIASVFDAGATDDGRPYFAMEYVPGMPITTYCDEQRLPTSARLTLFIEVCGAIQHAHQKGVIHRDLKPSNVLVMVQDGRAVPKVIDFGVAKATQQSLTEKTLFTHDGQFIGTPEYMSPEQAETTTRDVDATTDIYSLGVLLYELLVGGVPFDSRRLREAGYAEILRIIREEEPTRPSAKLTGLGAKASDVASRHQTSVRLLARELTGDLDWITLRALEKDRSRRYPSTLELAADIERHLADKPVVARPPSMAYRLRKLARRRRGAVIAAGLVATAFVFGMASLPLYARYQASQREVELDTQRRAYVAQVTQAKIGLDALDPSAALQALNQTVPELRGWEWWHLYLRADPSLATLHAFGPFQESPGRASSLSFSAGGRQLLLSTDSTVHVWDANSYRQTAVYGGFVTSMLALAPGGRLAVMKAAKDTDFTLQLVEPVSHDVVARLTGLPGDPTCAAFSQDGTRVAAGSRTGTIDVWDATSGRRLATFAGSQAILQVRFSPDGQQLASAAGDSVKIWPIASGGTSRILQPEGGAAMAFSPDGTHFASSAGDTTIRIWNLRTAGEPKPLQGHAGRVLAIAFSPDGARLASASDDRSVRIWNLQGDVGDATAAILTASNLQHVSSLAFDPQGQRLFTAERLADGATIVKVWDAMPRGGVWHGEFTTLTSTATVRAFSPDGRRLLASNTDGSVSVWNVDARRVDTTVSDTAGRISSPVFDPGGGRFAGMVGTTARIWNLETGILEVTMSGHAGDLTSIAFSPTGTEVITTSLDKTARIWDAISGRVLAKLDVAEQANAAVFTPDGAIAIVGSGNPAVARAPDGRRQTVLRWDWRAEQVTTSIDGCEGGAVTSMAISPDGRRVALSGSTLTKIWEWDDLLKRRIGVTAEQSFYVIGVLFTPDSRRLVSVSWDSAARVWDADTGDQLLAIPHGNRQAVGLAVSLTEDSPRIATSDGDNIYLWESRSPEEFKSATLVDAKFAQSGISADVVSDLIRDQTLSPDVRDAALRLARQKADDPDKLNARAWGKVVRPNAKAVDYREGLRSAEAARRAAPWNAAYLATIGLAQYRLGDDQNSIATLQSDGIPLAAARSPILANATRSTIIATATRSAILAMVRFKVGQIDQGKASLREAQTILDSFDQPHFDTSLDLRDLRKLINEAEGVWTQQTWLPAIRR